MGKLGPYELNMIVTGDARELAAAIPDESVDLIFTDPPYHKHNAFLFDVLGELSKRILKKGALVITLCGQPAFDSCFFSMAKHLDYYWLSNMPNSLGSVARYHPKQIQIGSKPVMWFSNGKVSDHPYIFDTLVSKDDKKYHNWGQSPGWFAYYIQKLTKEKAIIFDPFTGGGTVPAVCKMLRRQYLAFEIDPATAELARQRVANTQPPLPLEWPEQLEIEL